MKKKFLILTEDALAVVASTSRHAALKEFVQHIIMLGYEVPNEVLITDGDNSEKVKIVTQNPEMN